MGYAFISYSTKNQLSADSLRVLLAQNGIQTWMAPYDIPIGKKYAEVINQALKNCACLILLLTNDSQGSIWVGKEVERAISYRKPIMPIQLGDVVLNDEFELYISTDQIIPIHRVDETSSELKQIIRTIAACTETTDISCPTDPSSLIFDLSKMRIFASCGKERSIFKVNPTEKGVHLDINFEPTRLRKEIPDFAGAYCLKQPVLDIRGMNHIRFRARATNIVSIAVEIKPQGKAWMHEIFPFQLTDQWQEFIIDTSKFEYPRTLHCLEEITFVLRSEDFESEDLLCGSLDLEELIID